MKQVFRYFTSATVEMSHLRYSGVTSQSFELLEEFKYKSLGINI